MKPEPPKTPLRFLRWFCREDYLEEFEGDLIEIFEEDYEQSPGKARRMFSWSVIRYFRPSFIKFFRSEITINPTTMLKSDFQIAWRRLKKQPFFTFLNTFGLAIGMAGALLISLYIYDELSFNKIFADADRIYRIEISWWIFALAAFLAVAISILTVSYQSIKAATVNPVKSLRHE